MGAKTTFEVLDSSRKSSLLPEIQINLYHSMLRIRNAEETLAELNKEREMRTPVIVPFCKGVRSRNVTQPWPIAALV